MIKTRWLVSIIIMALIIVVGLLGCHEPVISESNSQKFPYETSHEEASEVLGIEVPNPVYLPEGYSIRKFLLDSYNSVSFRISDGNACEVILNIRWRENGLFPARFDAPKVYINDIEGYFLGETDSNTIWWNWRPNQDEPGIFVIELKSCKELPTAELIFIAESIG